MSQIKNQSKPSKFINKENHLPLAAITPVITLHIPVIIPLIAIHVHIPHHHQDGEVQQVLNFAWGWSRTVSFNWAS